MWHTEHYLIRGAELLHGTDFWLGYVVWDGNLVSPDTRKTARSTLLARRSSFLLLSTLRNSWYFLVPMSSSIASFVSAQALSELPGP